MPLEDDSVNHDWAMKPALKPKKTAFRSVPLFPTAPALGKPDTSACHQARLQLEEDRGSVHRDLALCISSCGCCFVSFDILL